MPIIEKDNKNYTLGRGKIYVSIQTDDTALAKVYRYIASTTDLTVNVEPEELQHINSDTGLRNVDKSIVLNRGVTGSFQTEDIQPENLALFFYGTASAVTYAQVDHYGVGLGEDIGVPDVNDIIKLGVTVDRPQGLQDIETPDTQFAVDDSGTTYNPANATPAATYIKETTANKDDDPATANYRLLETLNDATGRRVGFIQILDNPATVAKLAATKTANKTLRAYYKSKAGTRTQVLSGVSPVRATMIFREWNEKGLRRKWHFRRVILRANGDLAMKGQEWQAIPMSFDLVDYAAPQQPLYIDALAA